MAPPGGQVVDAGWAARADLLISILCPPEYPDEGRSTR